MRVVIYVEGPSDKAAMEALLAPLITEKSQQGIRIEFFPVKGSNNDRGGDAKKDLLTKIPIKAVDILRNAPNSIVIALPDLYPKNKGFPHETFAELQSGTLNNFSQALRDKGIADERLKERFQVFCFKYDLEALVLASESELRSRLETDCLPVSWMIPVEEQNHENSPRKVVEQLFKNSGKRYNNKIDAPVILRSDVYQKIQEIADRCPQCFKPFVEFLESLQSGNL